MFSKDKAEPEKPKLPIALMFPGQGSQYVKMISGVKDIPKVCVCFTVPGRVVVMSPCLFFQARSFPGN